MIHVIGALAQRCAHAVVEDARAREPMTARLAMQINPSAIYAGSPGTPMSKRFSLSRCCKLASRKSRNAARRACQSRTGLTDNTASAAALIRQRFAEHELSSLTSISGTDAIYPHTRSRELSAQVCIYMYCLLSVREVYNFECLYSVTF